MRAAAAFLSLLSSIIGLVGTVYWNLRAHRRYDKFSEQNPHPHHPEPVMMKTLRISITAIVLFAVVAGMLIFTAVLVRNLGLTS